MLPSRCLPLLLAGLAGTGAAGVGFAVTRMDLIPVIVGAATLLPILSHVRWVGVRRAVTEPSAITLILLFYLCVFPQRGLVIALNDFTDVQFVFTTSSDDLVSLLLLASLGTTVLVEAFHAVRTRSGKEESPVSRPLAAPRGLSVLAALLGSLAVASLAAVLIENGGVSGAQSVFLSHSKIAADEARSLALSVWTTLAVPAVWACGIAAVNTAVRKPVRLGFAAAAALIVAAQLVVFGSRLDALLAIMGVWIVFHYSRRPLPAVVVLSALPVFLLLSVPILNEREGTGLVGLSTHEQFSRISSYGVVDAALAVRENPDRIRADLRDVDRWTDLPTYLVPSPAWPNKPRIDDRRLDFYVAQSIGAPPDTGFPSGYVTELWLYGGWWAVLGVSLLGGCLLGAVHRRLIDKWYATGAPAALIWYCVVMLAAFSYFKDGDILMSLTSTLRIAIYTGCAMLLTGVWFPLQRQKSSQRRFPSDGVPSISKASAT
jgi:hypothetical protein